MYVYDTWNRFRRGAWNYQLSGRFFHDAWNYFTDIHPKTEGQYNDQKFFAGMFPYYGNWMQSRSQDERNRHTREQYSLDWSDIRYPWLSGVTSGNTSNVYGSASWQFSKNLSRLYR